MGGELGWSGLPFAVPNKQTPLFCNGNPHFYPLVQWCSGVVFVVLVQGWSDCTRCNTMVRRLHEVVAAPLLVSLFISSVSTLQTKSTTNLLVEARVVIAKSCSATDVNTAIATANEGDTVTIPPCAVSPAPVWGADSNHTVVVNKNISLQGSGVGTTVTLGATTAFTIDARCY